jgi:hypothetical protein
MREAGKMIADVHAVVEEGRLQGSCFRTLRGYARKPRPGVVVGGAGGRRGAPAPPTGPPPAVPVAPVPVVEDEVVSPAVQMMETVGLDRSGSIRIFLDTESLMG